MKKHSIINGYKNNLAGTKVAAYRMALNPLRDLAVGDRGIIFYGGYTKSLRFFAC